MRPIVALVVCVALAGCGQPKAKAIPRPEFEATVKGMTKDQVLERFGRPEETIGSTWYYPGMTHDPITNKRDSTTAISFRDDKAVGFGY